MRTQTRNILLLLGLSLMALQAHAKFTYEGYVATTGGTPITGAVFLRLQIHNPAGTCILYQEKKSLTASSTGFVSAVIDDGTGTREDSTGLTISRIFSNSGSMTGMSSCSYTPAAGDFRKLKVQVSTDDSTYDNLGFLTIYAAPQALNAEALAGYTPSNFLRVEAAGVPQNSSPLTTGNMNELMALITGASTQYMKKDAAAGASLPSSSGMPGSATAGSIWYNTTTNQIQFYDGTTAQTLGVAGAGLTSFNGLTAGAQTLAMGSAGTSPNWSSGSSVHTLNIPMASMTSVSAGLLSKADYDAFSAKLSAVGGSPLTNGNIWVGSPGNMATPVVVTGDGTISNTGTFMLAPNSVTTAKLNNSITGINRILATDNTTGTNVSALTCTMGQVLSYDVSNGWICNNLPSLLQGSHAAIGGNSIGAVMTLGTNDSQNLELRAGGTTRLSINPSGNVGIGTSSPASPLTIVSPATTAYLTVSSTSAPGKFGLQLINNSSTPVGGLAAGNSSASPPFGNSTVLYSMSSFPLILATNNVEQMRIDPAGNVGIGVMSPMAKLHVFGQIVSAPGTAGGSFVDFSSGNVQMVSSPGGPSITLSSMVDGGQYTVIISDTTARTYTFSGCSPSYYSPANATTSYRSIYKIVYVSGACYINWTTGYN